MVRRSMANGFVLNGGGHRCDESAATAGHPARDGDGEKIRAGIPAADRRVTNHALAFPSIHNSNNFQLPNKVA